MGRARGTSRLRRSLSDPSVAPSPPFQRRPTPPAAGHATDDDAISESDEELLSDDDCRRRPVSRSAGRLPSAGPLDGAHVQTRRWDR